MAHYGRVATGTSGSKVGTLDVAFNQPVAAGHKLFMAVEAQGLSGQDGPFTATDTKGNVWVERGHVFKSGTLQLSILVGDVSTALTTSDLIHVNHPTADLALWAVVVHDFDGVTDFDVSAVSSGASTNMAVGPTASGDQDVQLLFAAFAYGGSDDSFSPGSGFTAGDPLQVTNGTNYRNVACEWRTTNAPGTRAAASSSLSSSAWGAVLVVVNSAPQQQVVNPNGDIDMTGWTIIGGKSTYWESVSDNDPATQIASPESPSGATSGWMELGALEKPASGSDASVAISCRLDSASAGSVAPVLRSGTAPPFYTGNPQAVTGSLTTFEFTVPAADLVDVTNYSNWQIAFKPTASA